MRDKIYYKVVSKDLKSAIVNEDKKYCIQYKVGEWVETKHLNKGLLVFDSIITASFFIQSQYNKSTFKLYTCYVKNSLPLHIKYGVATFKG